MRGCGTRCSLRDCIGSVLCLKRGHNGSLRLLHNNSGSLPVIEWKCCHCRDSRFICDSGRREKERGCGGLLVALFRHNNDTQ